MSLILSGTDGLSDVDGSAATPALRGTDANTGIFFGADIIGFSEGGVEAARINADSQFVAAAGTAALPVITTTGDVNTGIFFPAADTIAFAEGGAEAMRIDSSGNVGIGVTPSVASVKLTTVGGPVQLSPGTTSQEGIRLTRASGICQINGINNDNNAYNALTFATGASESMRIDSSGNLLVGTTSSLGTLAASANSSGFIYGSTDALVLATNNSNANLIINRTNSNTAGRVLSVRYNGSEVGSISLTASTTAFNTSSDYRLKESITPMTGALAKVALLKPCTYKWKVDGSDGQGFIAHELAEVEAGCVTGEKDAVDAEGKPQYQGIDTSFLVATLTAAIQELKALTEAQASTITALTARITALETA